MAGSLSPWEINFAYSQQIIYLYLSVKFFFKLPFQRFHAGLHSRNMPADDSIVIIFRTLQQDLFIMDQYTANPVGKYKIIVFK